MCDIMRGEAFLPEVKRPGYEAKNSPHLVPKLKILELYHYLPYTFVA
jgi:hypothetical protein